MTVIPLLLLSCIKIINKDDEAINTSINHLLDTSLKKTMVNNETLIKACPNECKFACLKNDEKNLALSEQYHAG